MDLGSPCPPAVVVDDIAVNRLIIERFLRPLGVSVDIAVDGRTAVDAVASSEPPFDLVLLDCHMPIMDGVCVA